MLPIVEGYCDMIKAGMKVLEIGCGVWHPIKDRCEIVGAQYESIDIQEYYFGEKTHATRIENLADLSFEDEMFDMVIGNQSMEHWPQFGCRLQWGLYQCFRVCKPNGLVLMNVPIHFHGVSIFILGRLDELNKLFAPFSSIVKFINWGKPSNPLPDCIPNPRYWRLRGMPAYNLDIQAKKNKHLPSGFGNSFATTGYISQVINFPLSYNFYRVLRKTIWSGDCK